MKTTIQKAKPVDAKKNLKIEILPGHTKDARKCDGKNCVIARAFQDSTIGEYFDEVEVGITITKVTLNGKIMRYETPARLRPAIQPFDETGKWDLEEGEYTFRPPCKSMKLGARKERKSTPPGNNRDESRSNALKARQTPSRRVSHARAA